MSGPDFQVPLVLPDLRREESLAAVISSVAHLSKLAEHIFSTIEGKCDEFLSQLEGFNKVVFYLRWWKITVLTVFRELMMPVLRLKLSRALRKLQWCSRVRGTQEQAVDHTGKYSLKMS